MQKIVSDCAAVGVLAPAAVLGRSRTALAALTGVRIYACEDFDGPANRPDRVVAPSDGAMLQYTSGSTGDPKGVLLSHKNVISNERAMAENCGHELGVRLVTWLPIYHDMGLFGGLLQPLFMGGAAILTSPFNFLQKPVRWLRAISTFGAHTSGAPTFAYDLCVDRIVGGLEDLDLRSWKVAFVGAEPVRAVALDRFARRFAGNGFDPRAFHPCYGLAEATLVVTGTNRAAGPIIRLREDLGLDLGDEFLVSSGRPVGSNHVLILDPGSDTVHPEGAQGEICVAGPSVSEGYWGRSATNRVRLEGPHGPRSYLRTRDLGVLQDGELFVTGRLDDLMIIHGRNYHPTDLEAVFHDFRNVLQPSRAAAFAVEGDDRRVVMVVEVAQRSDWASAAWDEIFQQVRRQIAEAFDLALDGLTVVGEGQMPITTSGKVRRRHCRELYEQGDLTPLAEWRSAGLARSLPVSPAIAGASAELA